MFNFILLKIERIKFRKLVRDYRKKNHFAGLQEETAKEWVKLQDNSRQLFELSMSSVEE